MHEAVIIKTIQSHFPDVQAIYLFGSHGTEYERPDSDLDLALLLPVPTAKAAGNLTLSECWTELSSLVVQPVDLINLRLVNTVFQHEIIHHGRLMFKTWDSAVAQFEMITMSLYQKLNQERNEILEEVKKTKRILNV